jgi:prophage maintenance system killer protein
MIRFVTKTQVQAIHDQQLALFGGATGIIDEGKLESVLDFSTIYINLLMYNRQERLKLW